MEWPSASVDPNVVNGNDDVIHDLWIDVNASPTEYVRRLREMGLVGPPQYLPDAIKLPSTIPNPEPVVFTQ